MAIGRVIPGNFWRMARPPSEFNLSTSICTWVDLPDLSRPSKTTKRPRDDIADVLGSFRNVPVQKVMQGARKDDGLEPVVRLLTIRKQVTERGSVSSRLSARSSPTQYPHKKAMRDS